MSASDQFFVQLAVDQAGLNYNFGELPAATGAVQPGQTAGIGFWNNKNGQALIKSFNGGAQSTSLSEVELLALPRPVCDKVVSGEQSGPLTVNPGVTCIDGGTVHGSVTVKPGGELYAIGGKIDGSLSASGATTVVLDGTTVGGPVFITGTTGEVSIETAQIAGPVSLVNNKGPLASASTIGGPLSCSSNNPVPLDNGLRNTIRGPAAGQCAGM